ncbi:ABC transporter substrate-binding protein [Plantactinospora sp. KBS50]|uniref:ABC transporter substrate-binding protein n=1 Tax=Plantactinospora sp. KBS50 TaxID=2024580 RepID=UPI000BAB10AA|nr:ABC transporter substrate-binding protein [Plantactinospora sp. KBS50]ASW56913.1 hypothetical protein CIK06_26275 [Plantactinospora sp. KBS50]
MNGRPRIATPAGRGRPTRRAPVAALALLTVLVAGCAVDDDPTTAQSSSAASGHYPVTVENCGRKVTFDKAPSRVYLGFQPAAELFFELGLGDRAIAQIKPMDDPLPEQAADFARVPDKSPDSYVPVGKEEMLALRPDLLFAYVNSEYGGPEQLASGLATVDDLKNIGANVYALVCPNEEPIRVDFTYRALKDLGVIFDIEDRANALADRLKARVADVQHRVAGRKPVPVFFYYGGEGPIYTGTRDAYVDEMIRLAGGKNVFGDIGGGRRGFLEVSRETAAAKNPDFFLVDASPNYDQDAQAKADYLFRTFPEMQASKDRRFGLTYDTANTPGIRYVDVIENLARALHPDAFADQPAGSPATSAAGT